MNQDGNMDETILYSVKIYCYMIIFLLDKDSVSLKSVNN